VSILPFQPISVRRLCAQNTVSRLISQPGRCITHFSSPGTSDANFQVLIYGKWRWVRTAGWRWSRYVVKRRSFSSLITNFVGIGPLKLTIGTLPDDVLLETFAVYVDEAQLTEQWHTLVHVCRRWRHVIFSSPRRLHLQLLCTEKRLVREMLDIWPAFPIIIWNSGDPRSLVDGADNIIAALEHPDRVRCITLWGVPNALLQRFTSAMQKPFLTLTSLVLLPSGNSTPEPILPDSFLNFPGSAPSLKTLWLECIPFPALRKLHLSAGNLVHLRLLNIPHSGYISPTVMASCLSSLTGLKSVFLGFHSPLSRPDRTSRRLPPLRRTILRALTSLDFRGTSEYLEDLISGLDVPLLEELTIRFLNQLIWDTPRLLQFISRANQLRSPNRAELGFCRRSAAVKLFLQAGTVDRLIFSLRISCGESDWQLSSLAQICRSSLPPFSTLERLDIKEDQHWRPHPQDETEIAQWLEVLHSFTAVKNLYLSEQLGRRVAPALRELARETVNGVLPALQNLFLEGFQPSGDVLEALRQFITARQLLGHPVSVHRWIRVGKRHGSR
jgi:hypothetical protein